MKTKYGWNSNSKAFLVTDPSEGNYIVALFQATTFKPIESYQDWKWLYDDIHFYFSSKKNYNY